MLFDEEEKRRHMADYELKQLARSCSLMNLSMDDAMELPASLESNLNSR